MKNTGLRQPETVYVVTPVQRRRRYAAHEKLAVAMETVKAGQSVSFFARKYAKAPSQLYQWRKSMDEGARVDVSVNEGVVVQAEFKKRQERIRRLERLLGM